MRRRSRAAARSASTSPPRTRRTPLTSVRLRAHAHVARLLRRGEREETAIAPLVREDGDAEARAPIGEHLRADGIDAREAARIREDPPRGLARTRAHVTREPGANDHRKG